MKRIICVIITILLISVLDFTGSKNIPDGNLGLRTVRSIVNFGKTCKPESKYTDGCNLCICSIYGYALCTAMECLTPAIYSEPKEECTPGRRWKQDCNTCFCTENSTVKCTDLHCDGLYRESNFISDRAKRESPNEPCTQGHVTREGCLYCFCGRKGWKCLTMMCFGPELSVTIGGRRVSHLFDKQHNKKSVDSVVV